MPIHATTDEPTEVVNDTVYQVQKPDGSFTKKYVKVTKTYGENLDKDSVEAEVVLDRDDTAAVGRKCVISKSMLVKPDTYPGAMFSPITWVTKANQTEAQVRAEAEAFIDGWFRTEGLATAADNGILENEIDKVMNAIKVALTGFFGGFTLVTILHWLRGKIESSMAARGDAGRTIMPFERKLGTMKRELAERDQNLKTAVNDRGQYNAQHPYGAPRPVQQFQRPGLAS